HKWRSEEASIMVGTNTTLNDNPALNTRHWTGPDPVRLVVDMNLRLPNDLQIFNAKQKTIVFNSIKDEEQENLLYYKLHNSLSFVSSLMKACYELEIQSILVEGGTKLLLSFIKEQFWDEARVIENSQLIIDNGLNAPVLSNHCLTDTENILTDLISYYKNTDRSIR
ncbi:MAG TPA: dihydrofolate reductase family protein, partial [Segetibacter sp.]|nr:dihydrofolate reductase family protein [Segetibacter sp.]